MPWKEPSIYADPGQQVGFGLVVVVHQPLGALSLAGDILNSPVGQPLLDQDRFGRRQYLALHNTTRISIGLFFVRIPIGVTFIEVKRPLFTGS